MDKKALGAWFHQCRTELGDIGVGVFRKLMASLVVSTMLYGPGLFGNPPADEVREASPQAERTILDNLSPSQSQRVLEATLQHNRMADEREPGRPALTASAPTCLAAGNMEGTCCARVCTQLYSMVQVTAASVSHLLHFCRKQGDS